MTITRVVARGKWARVRSMPLGSVLSIKAISKGGLRGDRASATNWGLEGCDANKHDEDSTFVVDTSAVGWMCGCGDALAKAVCAASAVRGKCQRRGPVLCNMKQPYLITKHTKIIKLLKPYSDIG